jgi:hypothetical protein
MKIFGRALEFGTCSMVGTEPLWKYGAVAQTPSRAHRRGQLAQVKGRESLLQGLADGLGRMMRIHWSASVFAATVAS